LPGDTESATLQIGTTNGGANVASTSVNGPGNGSTGPKDVGIGTYFVGESGLTAGWVQTSLTCSTNGGQAVPYSSGNGVAVANGDSVVCTVTNTRQKGTVTLNKVWSGALANDTESVTLQIGTTNGGSNVASVGVNGPGNGSTGPKDVGIGTYFVR